MKCVFCDINTGKIENTIIEETNFFRVMPTVGSLLPGYLLIVSKRHVNSMSELREDEKTEYKYIINKYRKKFKNIYKKFPIVFEHGSPVSASNNIKANSIVHAHTHIVNYKFKNEKEILRTMHYKKINDINQVREDRSYILYIGNRGARYVTYTFKPISQLMRKKVAEDLGIGECFDWKNNMFIENIKTTLSDFGLHPE